MASVKWQCKACGATQTTQGAKPSTGGFCGKSTDHKHKWSKSALGPTMWKCSACGATQTTQGLRPSSGGYCGKASSHTHKWVKQ